MCRHGERMDVVFGKYWLSQCFDAKGELLVGLFGIGIPIMASRGQSQATFIWMESFTALVLFYG